MTPIEDSLLKIRSLRKVDFWLSDSHRHRRDYQAFADRYQRDYRVFVDELAHLRFPRLCESNMVAIVAT